MRRNATNGKTVFGRNGVPWTDFLLGRAPRPRIPGEELCSILAGELSIRGLHGCVRWGPLRDSQPPTTPFRAARLSDFMSDPRLCVPASRRVCLWLEGIPYVLVP